MYTTLKMIKTGEACTGGYARQLAFFGQNPKVRDQHIPIHAIGLIGGKEDISWAVNSAMIVDPEEFAALRERLIVPIWLAKTSAVLELAHNTAYRGMGTGSSNAKKYAHLIPLFDRALTLKTHEEIDTFLKEARMMNFEHAFFSDVVHAGEWTVPSIFIAYIVEHHDLTISHGTKAGKLIYKLQQDAIEARAKATVALEQMRTPVDAVEPALVGATTAALGDDDEEEDDNGPVADVPPPLPPLRNASSRYDEDEVDEETATDWVDDDEEEDESPRRARAAKKPTKSGNLRVFGDETQGKTEGRTIAKILHADPFKFMAELSFKTPPGVKVKKPQGVSAPILTVSVSKGEDAFELVKLLNSRQGLPDQV